MFSERIIDMLLGLAIGFIAGYITARFREKKLRGENAHVKAKEVFGFMRSPRISNVLYLFILVLVAVGAFQAQSASNQVEDAQKEISRVTACNQEYLAETIEALNQRTAYTQEQARLNVELQKSQSIFLAILLEVPPPSDERKNISLKAYFEALSDFVAVSSKTRDKAYNNPYPTSEDYQHCLDED